MATALELALRLSTDIESFPLHQCNPSDDPDKQDAYVNGFGDISTRFIAAARRVGDPALSEQLELLGGRPEEIRQAYELKANLIGVIDYLREASADPAYGNGIVAGGHFINQELLEEIRNFESPAFDMKKFVRFCEELNDSYRRGNLLASVLIMRAVLNHVPPLFGKQTFSQVVADSSRSVKSVLSVLEDNARPIADLHTHATIRRHESLPTKGQVDPFRAPFEILLHEVIDKLGAQQQG